MDFFTEQERARRATRTLIVLFLLAVAVIVLAVTFVVAVLVRLYTDPYGPQSLINGGLLHCLGDGARDTTRGRRRSDRAFYCSRKHLPYDDTVTWRRAGRQDVGRDRSVARHTGPTAAPTAQRRRGNGHRFRRSRTRRVRSRSRKRN